MLRSLLAHKMYLLIIWPTVKLLRYLPTPSCLVIDIHPCTAQCGPTYAVHCVLPLTSQQPPSHSYIAFMSKYLRDGLQTIATSGALGLLGPCLVANWPQVTIYNLI